MSDASQEIEAGSRFAFGDNWAQFLALVDDRRIEDAVESLRSMLHASDVTGRTFLDIGSGSGLFSLAAHRMGAVVTSFDFDEQSMACTAELRRRYADDDASWTVMHGSALDRDFLATLGQFDIVYSWGVLHHTGDMWAALANTAELVAVKGRLFISIYNNQGRASRNWMRVKQLYNKSGPVVRQVVLAAASAHLDLSNVDLTGRVYRVVKRMPHPMPQARARGMDRRRDLVDWVGGWPFEVARPEEIFRFFRDRGFSMDEMTTCGGGIGCNEFVFTRNAA